MSASRVRNIGAGIYVIVCADNGKSYIGMSDNIAKRLKMHIGDLQGNRHHNAELQRDWNKYGADRFEASVLKFIFEPSERSAYETRLIQAQDPALIYNYTPTPVQPRQPASNRSTLANGESPIKDFLTPDELAKLKGVDRRTIYNWIRLDIAPPYVEFGGRRWFYKEVAEQYNPPKRGRKSK